MYDTSPCLQEKVVRHVFSHVLIVVSLVTGESWELERWSGVPAALRISKR